MFEHIILQAILIAASSGCFQTSVNNCTKEFLPVTTSGDNQNGSIQKRQLELPYPNNKNNGIEVVGTNIGILSKQKLAGQNLGEFIKVIGVNHNENERLFNLDGYMKVLDVGDKKSSSSYTKHLEEILASKNGEISAPPIVPYQRYVPASNLSPHLFHGRAPLRDLDSNKNVIPNTVVSETNQQYESLGNSYKNVNSISNTVVSERNQQYETLGNSDRNVNGIPNTVVSEGNQQYESLANSYKDVNGVSNTVVPKTNQQYETLGNSDRNVNGVPNTVVSEGNKQYESLGNSDRLPYDTPYYYNPNRTLKYFVGEKADDSSSEKMVNNNVDLTNHGLIKSPSTDIPTYDPKKNHANSHIDVERKFPSSPEKHSIGKNSQVGPRYSLGKNVNIQQNLGADHYGDMRVELIGSSLENILIPGHGVVNHNNLPHPINDRIPNPKILQRGSYGIINQNNLKHRDTDKEIKKVTKENDEHLINPPNVDAIRHGTEVQRDYKLDDNNQQRRQQREDHMNKVDDNNQASNQMPPSQVNDLQSASSEHNFISIFANRDQSHISNSLPIIETEQIFNRNSTPTNNPSELFDMSSPNFERENKFENNLIDDRPANVPDLDGCSSGDSFNPLIMHANADLFIGKSSTI